MLLQSFSCFLCVFFLGSSLFFGFPLSVAHAAQIEERAIENPEMEQPAEGDERADRKRRRKQKRRATSEENREQLWGDVSLGLGFQEGAAFLASASAFLTPQDVLSFFYVRSSAFLFGSGSSASLAYQRFLHQSLYVSLGLTYRDLTFEDVFSDAVVQLIDSEFKTQTVIRDIGIDLSIGNKWQWKNFNIAVDWLGYFERISPIKTERRVRSTDAEGEVQNTTESASSVYPRTIRALRVSFGYAL